MQSTVSACKIQSFNWSIYTVAGPIEEATREEIMEAFKHLKIGRAHVPSEVYGEMILAREDDGIRVLMEPCQKILDGMPADGASRVAILFCKEMEIS